MYADISYYHRMILTLRYVVMITFLSYVHKGLAVAQYCFKKYQQKFTGPNFRGKRVLSFSIMQKQCWLSEYIQNEVSYYNFRPVILIISQFYYNCYVR